MDSQVLVAGAGPVGLMTAIQLARRGVAVRVVEKRTEPSTRSKALAVFARTLEAFGRVGLADQFVDCGRILRGAVLHAHGRELARMSMDELDSPFNFILCIPQSVTERLLEREARRLGVKIERGVEVADVRTDAESVRVLLRRGDGAEHARRAPWLVACDGAHSTVRHQLGLAYEGEDIDRWFMFADAAAEWPLADDRLSAFFDPGGVAVAIPLPTPRTWRVILSMPDDEPPPAQPTLELIESTFARRSGIAVQLRDPQWITRFTIRQRMVQQFRAGRAFLAGDAAHSHSPAGGQGMNAGLQDAENLAWKLALVMHGRAHDALLDTYEFERKPVARALLRGTGTLTRFATLDGTIPQAIRNHVVRWALELDFIERRATRKLAELDVGYTESPLSMNVPFRSNFGCFYGSGPAAGERAPVIALRDDAGRAVSMLSLIDSAAMTVLAFDDGGAARESVVDVQRWIDEQIPRPARLLVIAQERSEAVHAGCTAAFVDEDGAAHERYGVDGACMFGIRPDGVIGLRADVINPDVLQRWMRCVHRAER